MTLSNSRFTRRQFLKAGALGGAALVAGRPLFAQAPAVHTARRPNILFIISDQLGIDALSAAGCPHVRTPNMDRLARSGFSFNLSHTTDPVCSPARSSLFTGRMPSETGVVFNGLPIRDDIPNMGQVLGKEGYEAVYIGKWHVPEPMPIVIKGFKVIPAGIGGHGHLGDPAVSRSCEGYLRNRSRSAPFLLVASFLQPHDICQWTSAHLRAPDVLPYPEIAGRLPPLPPNFHYDEREPAKLKARRRAPWSERQWGYFLWSYYRQVEMVDAEIGRVLQALEDSGEAENTLVVLTADHGEGRGRHQWTGKNAPYEESVKVPLIFGLPGHTSAGGQDSAHLVSGLDIMPTVCDYAGAKTPANVHGRSLRPLMEGKPVEWRSCVVAEVQQTGRMVRTADYKYARFEGDPVEQFFDMKNDPWETKNLAGEAKCAAAMEDHRKLLREWESRLDLAAAPAGNKGRRKQGAREKTGQDKNEE
jgi:choline-sulfatase